MNIIEVEDAMQMMVDDDLDYRMCNPVHKPELDIELVATVRKAYHHVMAVQIFHQWRDEEAFSERYLRFCEIFGQPCSDPDILSTTIQNRIKYKEKLESDPPERWIFGGFGSSFNNRCEFYLAGFKTESDFVMFRLSI